MMAGLFRVLLMKRVKTAIASVAVVQLPGVRKIWPLIVSVFTRKPQVTRCSYDSRVVLEREAVTVAIWVGRWSKLKKKNNILEVCAS